MVYPDYRERIFVYVDHSYIASDVHNKTGNIVYACVYSMKTNSHRDV